MTQQVYRLNRTRLNNMRILRKFPTWKALEQASKVTYRNMARWMTDDPEERTEPKVTDVIPLAQTLNVPIEYLFGATDNYEISSPEDLLTDFELTFLAALRSSDGPALLNLIAKLSNVEFDQSKL